MIKYNLECSSVKELERAIESKINDMDGYRPQDHVIALCNDGTVGYFQRSMPETLPGEFAIWEENAEHVLENMGDIELLLMIHLYYKNAFPDEFNHNVL